MNNIICKIKSKTGMIYSVDNIEVTSIEETFLYVNRNKYIGLCVKTQLLNYSDIIHIAHFSVVKNIFEKYTHLIKNDRASLEETENWMNAYESMGKAINKDILGVEISRDSYYSMDLARYLEQIFHEKENQKEIFKVTL